MKTVQNIIVKYKFYHLIFWFVYHFFWWALISGSAIQAVQNIFFSHYTTKFLFYVVFQAFGVYFNLYYLIPKLLQKGKYGAYIFLLIATIFITSVCITLGYYVNALIVDIPFIDLFKVSPNDYFNLFKTNAFPSTLASMTLAMSIKLTKNWIASEKHKNIIEKEKLEAELKFLRSQFNPHFLFNTINSIFVLIHKNQDMASESLIKFSELLRYQLYQCNDPLIPLHKELDYLVNFIELEKLRQDTQTCSLDFDIDNSNTFLFKIAPFLLIPFIENAFKHVAQNIDNHSWIQMDLKVEDHRLYFNIENSTSTLHIAESIDDTSGIGLKNVKRRLELLYPDTHTLKIYKNTDRFCVSLELKLEKQILKQPKTA